MRSNTDPCEYAHGREACRLAVDIAPEKVRLVNELGLTGIDAGEVDPVAEIDDRTDGIGPDVVFATVGGEQTNATAGTDPRAQAFEIVRKAGPSSRSASSPPRR